MKKNVFFYAIIIICMAALVACSDNDNDNEKLTNSTETTAAFDNSSFGLYKGIIVGSSGTIKIEINNGNNVATATITIDGQTDELTCESPLTNGQAIVNVTFNGAFSSFTFSVDANGNNPVIVNIHIDGHTDVSATVAKETSTNVVCCYEGTYSGGNNSEGVLNIVRNNNTYSCISRGTDGIEFSFQGNINNDGTVNGSATTMWDGVTVTNTVSGKFNGDNVSGTWKTSWKIEVDPGTMTNTGTFTGKKTL